jgi:hypothetical protein
MKTLAATAVALVALIALPGAAVAKRADTKVQLLAINEIGRAHV